MAGALECAIYGRLLETPCVYIHCIEALRCTPISSHVSWLVGHSREVNVLEQQATPTEVKGTYDHTHRILSHEEGRGVWYTAFRSSQDDGY